MKKPQRARRGFSLVEVVLALGVAAFCLLAIFGLLPVGVNSNRISIEQTVAANMASLVMADLQAIPKGSSAGLTSPRFKIPAPPSPLTNPISPVVSSFFLREDGVATGKPGDDAKPGDSPRYRVTITFNVPAANQLYFSVPTRVLITWPALSDPTAATAPFNFSGSFEMNGSLARN